MGVAPTVLQDINGSEKCVPKMAPESTGKEYIH